MRKLYATVMEHDTQRIYVYLSAGEQAWIRERGQQHGLRAKGISHTVREALRLMKTLEEAQARGASVRIVENGKSKDLMILT